MALLHRLFQRKKNHVDSFICRKNSEPSKQREQFKFDKTKIRLVIYKDHDRGRTPLFDSSAIKKVEDPPPISNKKCGIRGSHVGQSRATGTHDTSGGQKLPHPHSSYQFQKLGGDVKVIEEMMFGAVAMAYRGSALKVHQIRTPAQLMLTKVFIPEEPRRESVIEMDEDSCSLPSHSGDFTSVKNIINQTKSGKSIAQSIPMDVPSTNGLYGSLDTLDEDSGLASFTSSGSFSTPFPSPSNNSSSSYNSLHRRWMRNQTTLLARRSTEQKLNEKNIQLKKKKCKVGMAVLIEIPEEKDEETNRLFQEFFFSHITLIEGHVNKLQNVVESAYFNKTNFIPMIVDALEVLRSDVNDLYMAPRLSEPVWLNMMTYSTNRYALCKDFMQEFMSLVAKYDNKSTKFFISTLISAVLTHHLAWVPTVTPAGGTLSSTYEEKHSAKWLDDLAKIHPYNPLWAQLSDLYGAIGYPLRQARTIVVGKNAELVKKLLSILSYFIRCSDIRECVDYTNLSSYMAAIHFDTSPVVSDRLSLGPPTPGDDTNSNSSLSLSSNPRLLTSTSSLDFSSLDRINAESVKLTSKEKNGLKNLTSNGSLGLSSNTKLLTSAANLDFSNGTKNSTSNLSESLKENQPQISDRIAAPPSGSVDVSRSTGQVAPPCSISALKVIENSRIETIQPVFRALSSREVSIEDPTSDFASPSSSAKLKSKLSQQLESETRLAKKEAMKAFLKEGSTSMYEEYFDAGIETKTIDEIDRQDLVITHPLAASGCVEVEGFNANSKGKERKISSRHNSVDRTKLSRPTSLNPGRCRSVTPTELNRRRNPSAASQDYDIYDPILDSHEVALPEFDYDITYRSIHGINKNFGRSLLGGISDHYLSDFVLHGTKDMNFRPKLLNDLQMTVQQSVLDEDVTEAVCIIADVDNWNVEIASSSLIEKYPTGSTTCVASQLVCNLIESVLDLWKLKMSPEFCMMHLEDRLQEIYFKSVMVAEYRIGVEKTNIKDLTTTLGFDLSDYHLLMAVAATHSPHLISQPTIQ